MDKASYWVLQKRIIALLAVALSVGIVACVPNHNSAVEVSTQTSAPLLTPTLAPQKPVFVPYRSADGSFTISYPSTWKTRSLKAAGIVGNAFFGTQGQIVDADNAARTMPAVVQATFPQFDAGYCNSHAESVGKPEYLLIGGTHWTAVLCYNNAGMPVELIAVTSHHNNVFYISEKSPPGTFSTNRELYFVPMEHSFAFNT